MLAFLERANRKKKARFKNKFLLKNEDDEQ